MYKDIPRIISGSIAKSNSFNYTRHMANRSSDTTTSQPFSPYSTNSRQGYPGLPRGSRDFGGQGSNNPSTEMGEARRQTQEIRTSHIELPKPYMTSQKREVEAQPWTADPERYRMGKLLKSAEEVMLRNRKQFDVLEYSEDCNGHTFNCFGFTLRGKCPGFVAPSEFSKFLEDDCILIRKGPIRVDDIVVHRNKYTNEMVHSSRVTQVENGQIRVIGSPGRLGIYAHRLEDTPLPDESDYQIYRLKNRW